MFKQQSTGGFALPAAVFALVVVGVLVTGGFYLARQETRIGVASERSLEAFYMAERGANEVMSEWDMSTYGALTPWTSSYTSKAVDGGVWVAGVTKMTNRLYLILSQGVLTEGMDVLGYGHRMTGYVARMDSPKMDIRAALSTVGNLTVGGSSVINGNDSIPPGWDGLCDPPAQAAPGILIDSMKNITKDGNKHETFGKPAIKEDNGLTSDSLLAFGEDLWNELTAMADKVYSDGQYVKQMHQDSVFLNGSYICSSADNWAVPRFNWGDPYNPKGACGSYFPVIYARGDLIVEAHDYGQGIMLVEGNLTFKGGFEFFGPVIVKGEVITEGTGGHFRGGLVAANVSLNASSVLGDALIQYSTCAVSRAVLNSALTRVRPLENRGWVDLSAVISG
jgi:hypothetical protein